MIDTSSDAETRMLNVPAVRPARYARSFTKLAICELRFPTMLEYEERAPTAFSKAVRHKYPIYERLTHVQLESSDVTPHTGHAFHSRNRRWTATVRASALSVETEQYGSFDELRTRIEGLIGAAKSTVQSDFFTRVGLRLVNAVHCTLPELAQWINPMLVQPLAAGTYGDVEEHWQRVRGRAPHGGYNFMHGIIAGAPDSSQREYVLDFDFFSENVELSDTLAKVDALHADMFSMLHWSLGDAAKAYLGEPLDVNGG